MFNEIQLKYLCNKYNIKYKLFQQTDILLLDTQLDEWMIKYTHGKDYPYCLMHKNKLRQTSNFHVQRYLRTVFQAIDSIASHKKILMNIYHSPLHKRNANIKRRGKIH